MQTILLKNTLNSQIIHFEVQSQQTVSDIITSLQSQFNKTVKLMYKSKLLQKDLKLEQLQIKEPILIFFSQKIPITDLKQETQEIIINKIYQKQHPLDAIVKKEVKVEHKGVDILKYATDADLDSLQFLVEKTDLHKILDTHPAEVNKFLPKDNREQYIIKSLNDFKKNQLQMNNLFEELGADIQPGLQLVSMLLKKKLEQQHSQK
ncbi:Ubiquitin-like_domain superfamily [Hexamita inflata]|uniref:Ubiquitin-like domain superfamily n=1 Tax=Hexamita inflata TaxID=28002 RepID=A0AA86PPJ6_9EUKA|nr:Ubiquitin-like domain superfamily [Hexamita inflata]